MNAITAYEYDVLVEDAANLPLSLKAKAVPTGMFSWLQAEAIRLSETSNTAWVRLSQTLGRPAVRLSNHVGVVRSADGFQLEILPKIAKVNSATNGDGEVRKLLIEMLRCLDGFRFIQSDKAMLAASEMPLLEVFIAEFLRSAEYLVKRGLRRDYITQQNNQFALRGKLLISQHLRSNLVRKDRFYTEHDEYSLNRPANRLLRKAINRVLTWSLNNNNQKRARELSFIFSEVPSPDSIRADFQRLRLDRGMEHYQEAMSWVRLILGEQSPLTGQGTHSTISLLFPMEAVFEAYVAKHLRRQLKNEYQLTSQVTSLSLVKHQNKNWFRLKPDLLIRKGTINQLVLDTKWKLIDTALNDGSSKYNLSQADFYQLFAYGKHYLKGEGDVVLIYPKTENFKAALSVFEFTDNNCLKLWVVPFCLHEKRMILPACDSLNAFLSSEHRIANLQSG